MLIDWFTVGAQIINFLVLMALLKIFLYDRVIRAMDEREEKITSRLEEADGKRREAEERRERIEKEEKAIGRKREKMLADAGEAARSKQKEMEQEARAHVNALRDRWIDALDQDKEAFAGDLRRRATRQVLAVTRRVLADMADEDLRDRFIEMFSGRIRRMSDQEKQELIQSLDEKKPSAVVLSDAEVSTSKRQQLTRLLRKEMHPDLAVAYRKAEDLLGGLELRVPGKKIAWNIQHHLDELEQRILHALEAASRKNEDTGAPQRNGGQEEKEKSGKNGRRNNETDR